jgi:flavin reductase (DIM6/NTAB) family NADH-FMN oxidoreductase RutF
MTASAHSRTWHRTDSPELDESGDHRALRDSYATFPSGVTVVAALVDGEPVGMLVSSFVTVSLDPPLVSISMDHGSSTWPSLRRAQRLGVSVLAAGHEATARQFAGPAAQRFDGVDAHTASDGAVLVGEAAGWFECTVHAEVPAGDHDLVLLRVLGHGRADDAEPIVFHGSRFRWLSSDE